MARTEAVGTVLGEVTFPVERGKIAEFARAVLADEPEYFDPGVPGGIVAPPTFLQTVACWEPQGGPEMPDLGVDWLRVVHGEQEFELLAPVRVGDVLTATSTVCDVYPKTNSRGEQLWFVVLENRFANEQGDDVAFSRMILIETPPPRGEDA